MMTDDFVLEPIPTPSVADSVPSDAVASGLPVPPIERIKLFSDSQWEEFILEWADSLRDEYARVERYGGSGDMGCDIVATCKDDEKQWDNYQCKRYQESLKPSDIWIEFGKLVYYSHRGDYSYPRRYSFVAPQGAGNKLSRLLKQPSDLKAEVIRNWDAYCLEKITDTTPVPLEGDLREYLDGLDFSIFDAIPPLKIIDAHAKTRWYIARFGGGLPQRPPVLSPPATPTAQEATYVRELLAAYASYLRREVESADDLGSETDLRDHFSDSRREFYSAESLRAFSRDTLPPGEFESLQDEIHSGIADDVRSDHEDGYRRVIAVVRSARMLQLTAHALISRLSIRDRGGICHQLANDSKVRWVR